MIYMVYTILSLSLQKLKGVSELFSYTPTHMQDGGALRSGAGQVVVHREHAVSS